MDSKSFSIRALLKEGWELFKVNSGFLVVYQIILYILTLAFGSFESGWKMAPFHLLGFLIVTLGHMGLYQSILMMTTGNKPRFDQFYSNWPQFLSWLIASILFSIAFTVGLFLLIVPGFYILARYGLFPFFVLDQKLDPIESLSEAGKATEGVRWHIFLLFVVCGLLNILGLLFFFVGFLITLPITLFALATVYRQLTGQSNRSIQPADIED
jgi:uncharacterized membrane protein